MSVSHFAHRPARPGWSALFALTSLAAAACSRAPFEPAGGVDLLARTPDGTTWQAGEIAVGTPQWKDLAQFGWETVEHRFEGRTYVWSSREHAYVHLPTGPREDRELTLEFVAKGRNPEAEVALTLNGTFLESLSLAKEHFEHRVLVPAPLWIEGDNLLELVCRLETTKPGWQPVGVGLARVSYGEPRHVHVDLKRRSVSLDGGTAVSYRLEPLSQGRVVLGGHAPGAGTLAATFTTVDPATGMGGTPLTLEFDVLSGQDFEHLLPLGETTRLIELRLSWQPADGPTGAPLALNRIELQESEPIVRPPIVLISIDTLSARHMSVYGYSLPTTPSLERFAKEAYVFEQCYSNAPWTLPSFMSLMSGLYAGASQIEGKGSELWERWYLSSNRWTMPEFLRAAGYRTGGFVDNAWITKPFGFPQGFDLYDASAADNNVHKHTDPDGGIRQTLESAREFLGGLEPESPFFLFVHAFDVHGPYTPPAPFDGRLDGSSAYDQERTAPAGGPANGFGIIPTYIARGEVRSGALPGSMRTAPIEGAYDEGIQFVDRELGEFFDELRSAGVLDRAWVVVTADHGETMADTAFYFGHGVLDQDVVRVPLLIRPPGGVAGGRRIADAVQLVDLYPTVIDILGSGEDRTYLHGRSLVPYFEQLESPPRSILSEGGLMRQAMLVADGWKLVEHEYSQEIHTQALLTLACLSPAFAERVREWNPNAPRLSAWKANSDLVNDFYEVLPRTGLTDELLARMQARHGFDSLVACLKWAFREPVYALFDLSTDPEAKRDVASEHQDVVAQLRSRLAAEQQRRETARQVARPPTQPVELSTETVAEIEALGYSGSATE